MHVQLDETLLVNDPALPSKLSVFTKVAGPDECWMWTGEYTLDGTPFVRVRTAKATEEFLAAHRVAAALREGGLREGDRVFRSCKSKGCMNPAHASVKRVAKHERPPRPVQGQGSGNGLLWLGEHEREVQVLYALYEFFRRTRPDETLRA